MSYRMMLNRFTRTAYVMDLRTNALEQRMLDIKRKACKYEVLKHTNEWGRSEF